MLKVRIETNNDAFAIDNREELRNCLVEVMQKLTRGDMDGKIYDSNGNPVGNFKLTNK